MTQDENIELSKTQKKNQMQELQDLGLRLTKLSLETLRKIGLPEDLYQAIVDQKKITANGALKRQTQYIGRLMRDVDPAPIRLFLDKLSGDDNAHKAFLHRLEALRDELIANDSRLDKLVAELPNIDITQIRTLIRNTRKERELNKPPKAFRALFQELKTAFENQQDPDDHNDE